MFPPFLTPLLSPTLSSRPSRWPTPFLPAPPPRHHLPITFCFLSRCLDVIYLASCLAPSPSLAPPSPTARIHPQLSTCCTRGALLAMTHFPPLVPSLVSSFHPSLFVVLPSFTHSPCTLLCYFFLLFPVGGAAHPGPAALLRRDGPPRGHTAYLHRGHPGASPTNVRVPDPNARILHPPLQAPTRMNTRAHAHARLTAVL